MKTNLYDTAMELAKLGFSVFPLEAGGKKPIIQDFPNKATRNEEQISSWWEMHPDANIGISTSHGLVVVDVDNKNGKCGSDTILELELEGKTFPATCKQTTPTGGHHLIYKNPLPVKQGVDVLGKGLDIRSKGGYIVGRGSIIGGKRYVKNSVPITPCPQWILDKCGEAPESQLTELVEVDGIDQTVATRKVREYLICANPSLEGQGGNHQAYSVAAKVKDLGVDEGTAFSLMYDEWNDRCEPPWSPDELELIVKNAYRYGTAPVGVEAPENQFEEVPMPVEGSYLDKINSKYALIFEEGGHSILHETVTEKGAPKRVFMQEVSFKRKFSNTKILQEKGRPITHAEQWLDWEGRREYYGLCFKPEEKANNGYYNLWAGFSCTPKPYAQACKEARKGFDDFKAHALHNVCGSDQGLYTWLMGYFAHLIQKPNERPLTTLVFKGSKGVGKNALMDRVGGLVGRHYLTAHSSRFLTSNFNGHMDSCLCLVLDEAFWSGDKGADGLLKGITTSPEIMIERKGKEAYQVDNLMRVVIIGNEDWLVPASTDERRYAVFEVGEGHKQKTKYFRNMRVNIDKKGGNQVLLHYLKTFDLESMDVNTAPVTKGLLTQKMASLDLFGQFWNESLEQGSISGIDFKDDWPEVVRKDQLRDAFYTYSAKRRSKAWTPSMVKITNMLRDCCANTDTKIKEGDKSYHAYKIGTLEHCRKVWSSKLGHEIKWNND